MTTATAARTITLHDVEYWDGHTDAALASVVEKYDSLGMHFATNGHADLMADAIGIAAAAFAQLASRR